MSGVYCLDSRPPKSKGKKKSFFIPINKIIRKTTQVSRNLFNKISKGLLELYLSPKFRTKPLTNAFPELRIINKDNEKIPHSNPFFDNFIQFNPDHGSNNSKYSYPFHKISKFLKEKDIVMVNLENPLSDHPRAYGGLIAEPGYAQALKENGITVVNLANNHIFDAGEIGFSHTLKHLSDADIQYTGAGISLSDARDHSIIEKNQTKFAILNYTHRCRSNFSSVAADYPGILPLDPNIIFEDIEKAKIGSNFIFVVLHWGIEDQPYVHARQIRFAHDLIDSGVDCIIGHHSHEPHGIEIYRGKPIFYSLGNFIFGHSKTSWINKDNFLAEILIENLNIVGVLLYPISGKGTDLFQPYLLNGDRAISMLDELQIKSLKFNTRIIIENDVGHIAITS